jgi:hypothetical protein
MANPYQGDDIDPFSGVRDEETGEIIRKKEEAKEESKAEASPQSFKSAFAAARKAGDKTFMFGGKKYTTKLKEEKDEGVRARPASGSPKDNPYYGRTVSQRAASLKAKGGSIKMAKGGSVKSSASKRADGCAVRGKTRGKVL